MKVAHVPRYGPPDVVELRDVPTPVPGPGQVGVQVLAAAVTAGDWRIRSGVLPAGFGPLRGLALGFGGPRKAVLGTDLAGVVDAVGDGVTRFRVGDAVLAFPGSDLGGHAEFIVMPADGRVVLKPTNLTFEEAAALPFGGMTALDFFHRADLQRGERVLVNGASGNVGTAAVQLARHLGAHVTGVCSAENASLVRDLGADDVVDYTTTDFATGASRFDVIVDAVGNAPWSRVEPVLAPGGRLLAVLAGLREIAFAFTHTSQGRRVIAGPCAEKVSDLVTLAGLAEQGVFKPVLDRCFGFDQIADAYRVVDSGRKKGSVIVSLDPRSRTR